MKDYTFEEIKDLSYIEMLRLWRFAPLHSVLFVGEKGAFFKQEMARKKKEVDFVAASKVVGW